MHRTGKRLTGVSLPVEVFARVAVALQIQSALLPRGTVCERNVVVADLIEKVNFVLLQHKSSSNRVNGRITPALVEETTIMI